MSEPKLSTFLKEHKGTDLGLAPVSKQVAIKMAVDLEAKQEALEGALQEIKFTEGKVCEEYGTCKHSACRSSYTMWAIADKTLASVE